MQVGNRQFFQDSSIYCEVRSNLTKRILPESLLKYFLRFFLLCLNCDCYSNRRKYVAFSSFTFSAEKWYFVFKIVLTYCEKNSSIDQEKLLQLIGLQSQIFKIMRSLKVALSQKVLEKENIYFSKKYSKSLS